MHRVWILKWCGGLAVDPSRTRLSAGLEERQWPVRLSKSVSVGANGKVELEDSAEVSLNTKLRTQTKASVLPTRAAKFTVRGSNTDMSHTVNEDERKEFTDHSNGKCSRLGQGDAQVRASCLYRQTFAAGCQ
ncbi:hypothetical protein HD554DRAFT_814991 [Boletus coccyginus]|nr:hypothetical protein HD554DRAFT_814991 [Boletus coccyginus]